MYPHETVSKFWLIISLGVNCHAIRYYPNKCFWYRHVLCSYFPQKYVYWRIKYPNSTPSIFYAVTCLVLKTWQACISFLAPTKKARFVLLVPSQLTLIELRIENIKVSKCLRSNAPYWSIERKMSQFWATSQNTSAINCVFAAFIMRDVQN